MMPAAPPVQATSPWGYPQPAPAGYPQATPAGYPQPAYPAYQQPAYAGYPPAANLQRPAYAYPPATNYAPGYYPQAQPARPKSNHLVLWLILIPLALFVVIILVKVASSIGGTDIVVPTETSVTPTTTTSPTGTQTTTPPPAGQYANDDYVVPDPDPYPPDLPFPDTYDTAASWMQYNVIYNSTAPAPVRCELDSVDPSKASKAEMTSYLNQIVACLMRVWAPELQAAGFNAARPSVTVYSGSGQSACGKFSPQNAFYCAADQQVYYSMDLPSLMPKNKSDPYLPVLIIAHEFGHAIQAQTGILLSERVYQQEMSDEGNDATSNQLSRRLEVQADCFAGQFNAAVQQSIGLDDNEFQFMLSVMMAIGDDTLTGDPNYVGDHGHGANRQAWFTIGFKNTSMGACNTFADSVTDDEVA